MGFISLAVQEVQQWLSHMREARNPTVPQVTRLGAQEVHSGSEGLKVSAKPGLLSVLRS